MTIDEAIDAVCDKEPLFTALVRALTPVEDNKNCPTLGTDGIRLMYNSDYMKTLSDEETCAVVLHEVLHCAFRHQWRREEREPFKWNIACDYAINTVVNESFRLPEGALLDTKYFGLSADAIYDMLGDDEEQQSWCEKHRWGKGTEKDENAIKKALNKVRGKKATMTDEEKRLARIWKKLFEKNVVQKYGDLPESLKRVIQEDYYIPVVDWASLVASFLSEDVNDYTFATPDRRFLEADYILPAQLSEDKLKDVIFAYDTSGSISDENLHAFYRETLSLFKNFPQLQAWIGICDADLHSFGEMDSKQTFESFGFTGGGGTDFRPVFNELKTREIKPKALFYFTDTYGAFPEEEPEFPVFWMVHTPIDDAGETSLYEVPFGRVIKFIS